VVLGNDFVMEELEVDGRKLSYKQLEGGFTQPNAGVSVKMLEWARCAAVNDTDPSTIAGGGGGGGGGERDERRSDDFLELYCGNGNFTVAMAPMFRKVLATEMSKVSVAAARENFAANEGADNITVARLSSEELTQAMDGVKTFKRLTLNDIDLDVFNLKTVLVDPPRAGMGPEVSTFVSRFPRIVYISCNPETLAEDVRTLEATHRVARFAVFDQFPYTPHLECGALLVAKEQQGEEGDDDGAAHQSPDESGEWYPIDQTFVTGRKKTLAR
jgi:tRNA (uracil-5-)-methyltransferase